MNRNLKRVALGAPVLIVLGVYLELIPVGPGLKKVISPEDVTQPEKKPQSPVITMGESLGDVSFGPSKILTGAASRALLRAGSGSVILTEGSELYVDKVLSEDPKALRLNLRKGGLIGEARIALELILRTPVGSFRTTDAVFSLLVPNENEALLLVKTGVVEAENFKDGKVTKVIEGHTFQLNRDGREKLTIDLDALDLFDWSLTLESADLPSFATVSNKVGSLPPVLSEAELIQKDRTEDIDRALEVFRENHRRLLRENEILKENAEASREGFTSEKRRLERDIQCLETSASECNLFGEKILRDKGFPRMWGTPRYRHDMVVTLQKYILERRTEVEAREEEAKILTALMGRREKALRESEVLRENGNDLEAITKKLEDPRLRR